MTNYIARYGLEFNPFLKTAKQIFLETGESKEVQERLGTLGETKGIGILTGAYIPMKSDKHSIFGRTTAA